MVTLQLQEKWFSSATARLIWRSAQFYGMLDVAEY
jgi:hypothetical protein